MMNSGPISRHAIVGGALTLAGLFIFVWMIRIQTSESAQLLSDRAKAYYLYTRKTIYPERGNIYDRWGHLMAGNTEVYELGVDLRYLEDPQTVAMNVSSVLGLDFEEIYAALTIEFDPELPAYVVLSKSVTPEKVEELQALSKQLSERAALMPEKKQASMPSLSGLLWTPNLQRSYPEHSL